MLLTLPRRNLPMKYLNNAKVLFSALASCAFGLLLTSCAHAQQSPENIALGKTVTFNKAPNYSYSTDPDDKIQLTDGKYSSEGTLQKTENTTALWVQKSTVGWQSIKPVIITIDLGTTEPISGVSYSTAAGSGGATWPTAIYMAVSNDNKTWRAVGNLTILSRKNGTPSEQGYAAFRYVTHDLHTAGRYISFAVIDTPFVFSDEIEVYKGDNVWLNQPAQGEVISSITDYANACQITSAAQRRLYDDISTVRKEMQQVSLSPSQESTFTNQLDQDAAEADRMPQLGPDYKTILPLNDTHRDILAVHGELLAAQGIAPLTVWKMHRYASLPYLAKPSGSAKPQLSFSMLGNQFRSDDLLLTNAGAKPKDVTLQLKNAPRNAQTGWLQVYSVAWTDTSQGTPVANALIPVEAKGNDYTVEVPAGMTRKVWFTIDSSKVTAGDYNSTFIISSGDQHSAVPLILSVSPRAMNTPRLSLTMWDYSNGKGQRGITLQNREAAIAMMRSHYVNTPWASKGVLPWPETGAFDAQGNLKEKLDFSNLDAWIALWPDAKHYMVFANIPDYFPDSFAGAKMGTPEFNQRVGSWAKALSAHLKEIGLQPKQLAISLVDEPYHESQDAIIAAWAEAIKAAAPDLALFSDPRWQRPDQTKIQDAITTMDILCSDLPRFITGGEPVQTYFSNLRAEGKHLWFYQADGPSWEIDPQLYYRYQAWHAFAASATGEGFWSFGDTGNAPTSWNGYSNTGVVYAPAYLGENTVTDSIHWDAVREGVEDYEELAMLKDAVNASPNAAWKMQAQQTLDDAVKAVTGIWSDADYMKNNDDPGLADAQLQKVQYLLNEETSQ